MKLTEENHIELLHKLAISFINFVNAEFVRESEVCGYTPRDIFEIDPRQINNRMNLRSPLTETLKRDVLDRAKRELEKVERFKVDILYLSDPDYPFQLAEIPDAPVVLYKIGDAELSNERNYAVVGTRRCTSYGVDMTRKLVSEMAELCESTQVISGLAYGIDACAHSSALASNVPTVAVMATGLNKIYPAAHRDLAAQIVAAGGALITENPFDTTPYQRKFLERNRIIAGLTAGTIVVESEIKGGALSTANYAFGYGREVMAVPGRSIDISSQGCNNLIITHKAALIMSARDVADNLGWQHPAPRFSGCDATIFKLLEGDAKKIYELLKYRSEPMSIDELHQILMIPVGQLLSLLSDLEFEGIVNLLPGKRYTLA